MPCMAFKLHGETAPEMWLMQRAGYGQEQLDHENYVFFAPIDGSAIGEIAYDFSDWGNRTRQRAHHYIEEHWDELKSGDVVDVEYILGETSQPKRSEIFEEMGC